MTKEDKQIIKRATKEEWRIGDRTRLKRLLEKNLEQYRENKTLEGCLLAEQEHTLMLERENRLLGERCNQLLKDKGELTDKIEKMKCCGNCSHRRYCGNELNCNLDLDKQFECDNNKKKYWEFKKE